MCLFKITGDMNDCQIRGPRVSDKKATQKGNKKRFRQCFLKPGDVALIGENSKKRRVGDASTTTIYPRHSVS